MFTGRARRLVCGACRTSRAYTNAAIPQSSKSSISRSNDNVLLAIKTAIHSNRITDAISLLEQWKRQPVDTVDNQSHSRSLSLSHYNALLTLCVRCSEPISAISIIRSMISQSDQNQSVAPNQQSWCSLIECLVRRHDLEPAWSFYRAVFRAPDVSSTQSITESQVLLLQSLLDASMRHNPSTQYAEFVNQEISWLANQSKQLAQTSQSNDNVSQLKQLIDSVLARGSAKLTSSPTKSADMLSEKQLLDLLQQGPPQPTGSQSLEHSIHQQSLWCRDMVLVCARTGEWVKANELTQQLETLINQSIKDSADQSITQTADSPSHYRSLSSLLAEATANSQIVRGHSRDQQINQSINPSTSYKSLLQCYKSLLVMSRSMYASSNQSVANLLDHHSRVQGVIDRAVANHMINNDQLMIAILCSVTPVIESSTSQSIKPSINQSIKPSILKTIDQLINALNSLSQGIPFKFNQSSTERVRVESGQSIKQSINHQHMIGQLILSYIKKYATQPSPQLMDLLMKTTSNHQSINPSTVHQLETIESFVDLYLSNGTFPKPAMCTELVNQSINRSINPKFGLSSVWNTYSKLNQNFQYTLDIQLIDRLIKRCLSGLNTSHDSRVAELPQIIELINQSVSPVIHQCSPRTLSGVLLINASFGGEESIRMIDSIAQSIVFNELVLTESSSDVLCDLLIGLCIRPVGLIDCTLLVNMCKKHWQKVTPLHWKVVQFAEIQTRVPQSRPSPRAAKDALAVTEESLEASWSAIQKLQSRQKAAQSNQSINQTIPEFAGIRPMLKYRRKLWLTQKESINQQKEPISQSIN